MSKNISDDAKISQEDARDEIVRYMKKVAYDGPGSEADHRRIVELLQLHPDLAKEELSLNKPNVRDRDREYQYGVHNHDAEDGEDEEVVKDKHSGFLPLCHLLTDGASLGIIQSAVEVYPDALRYQSTKYPGHFPLHIACTRNCSSEVVEYLARARPAACHQYDRAGRLPIHYEMERYFPDSPSPPFPASTIKELIKLCPSSLKATGSRGLKTQELSFHDPIPRDICGLAAAMFEPDGDLGRTHFHFSRERKMSRRRNDRPRAGITLDIARSEALALILPRISRFVCIPTAGTHDGTIHLLQQLQTNESIDRLEPLTLSRRLLSSLENNRSPELHQAFHSFVAHNRTVSRLSVSLADESAELTLADSETPHPGTRIDQDLLETLESALGRNQSIITLELSKFQFHQCHYFRRFLALGTSPRCLRLVDVRWAGYQYDDDCIDWSSCCVEKLEVITCMMFSSECWVRMLRDVAQMPLLTELAICFDPTQGGPERIDTTEPLLTMMAHNKLERVFLAGYRFQLDFSRFCEGLARNTSLKKYRNVSGEEDQADLDCVADVLERHNVTFHCAGQHSFECCERLWYYTHLNKYGRARIREESTTLNDFVGLLCSVREEKHADYVDDQMHMIFYGLLREKPAIWCSWQTGTVDEASVKRLDDLWGTVGKTANDRRRYLSKLVPTKKRKK